jgi:hypothetical protein
MPFELRVWLQPIRAEQSVSWLERAWHIPIARAGVA